MHVVKLKQNTMIQLTLVSEKNMTGKLQDVLKSLLILPAQSVLFKKPKHKISYANCNFLSQNTYFSHRDLRSPINFNP